MADVTMNVRTYMQTAFPADERLAVRFVPSGAAVSSTAAFPLREVKVEAPADGNLEVSLAPTTHLTPRTWYDVRFEWFDKHPVTGAWQLRGWSQLPGRLNVPYEGGDVTDLLSDYDPGTPLLFLGYGPPPEWLPSPGVYYDISGPDGPVIYSDGVDV